MTDGNELLNKVICGDCLNVMKTLPDKSIDLIITDPPYGIGADKGVGGYGSASHTAKHYQDNWDIRPAKIIFDEILRVA